MSTAGDVVRNVLIGLALSIGIGYFVIVGMIMRKGSAVGVKRVWLIDGLLIASIGLVIGKNLQDKILLFIIVFPVFLIPGHLKMFPQIKENRRPLSSGKNFWEKILIFFWY